MSLVQSFSHLSDQRKADRALALLQRVASLVKPIMRRHGWNLPVLAEFYPDDQALNLGLNVNAGSKICLRLRRPGSPESFYEDEQVVLVMLHELTHNVHGPHDQQFYKFLSGLEAEWEELKRSGYSGEGFHSAGRRVGMGISHDVPPTLARQKALQAAEQRRRRLQTTGFAGRLGGQRPSKSARELAAEAAERRARDETACGSVLGDGEETDRTRRETVNHTVIVVDSPSSSRSASPSDPSHRSISTYKQSKEPLLGTVATSTHESITVFPGSTPRKRSHRATSPGRAPLGRGEWACSTCTLINGPLALQCMACSAIRPFESGSPTSWTCHTCGTEGIDHQFWSCRVCGTIKTSSSAG